MAWRVAATVVRMPPAAYGCPAILAANSAARSPAKTRCEWESTKPGQHGAAAGVDLLVGGGRVGGGADPLDRGPVDDEGALAR